MENDMWLYLIILFLSIGVLVALIIIYDQRKKNDKIINDGKILEYQAETLSEYYSFSYQMFDDIFNNYIVYKENAIDNVIKQNNTYTGSDPIVQNLLKSTLEFDKFFREKHIQFNKKIEEINDSEEENEE